MLKIRLQRIGRKGRPFYRIVVAEHTFKVKGAFVERLGHYDPLRTPKVFELNETRFNEWIKKGAKPSSTLARILKGRGVKGMEPYIQGMADRKKKKEQASAAESAPAAAPAPEASKV